MVEVGEGTLSGARVELALTELAKARDGADELRRELGDAEAEVLAGEFDADIAHLWVFSRGVTAAELHELLERRLGGPVISFRAKLVADEGDTSEPRTSPLVVPIPFAAPPDQVEVLDLWYDEEHSPLLLEVPGWSRSRRFELTDLRGGEWSRLSVHDLADEEVIKHPGVRASMQTPRRRAFESQPWFMAGGRKPLARLP